MAENIKQNLLRIGMAQLLVEGGEPERNFERAEVMIKDASSKDCQIILLPECMDLAWTHPSSEKEAKSIPGEYSDIICKLARKYSIYICCGLTEEQDGKVYNSAILVSDDGQIILKYQKINVLEIARKIYETGQSLNVVDTKFGKIGLNICSDNYEDSLDIGYVLARMGAQLILSPSSWTSDFSVTEIDDAYGKKWLSPYSYLAKSFDLIIVSATSVGTIVGGPYEGKKMVGCSLAVGSEGVLARGNYNEFAGELVVAAFNVPLPRHTGTEVSKLIKIAEERLKF